MNKNNSNSKKNKSGGSNFKKGGNGKAYYGSKGKGNNRKSDEPKPSIDQESAPKDSLLNEVDYYFTSQEVAEQASQLSFQNFIGFGDIHGYKVPSIARVDMALCPGNTIGITEEVKSPFAIGTDYATTFRSNFQTGKSGVNLMASKLYTTLSSFTGRTAQYAPQDVAMNICAVAAVAEWSETVRRAFGLALTYQLRNRTLPLGILRSMGLDVQDLISNLSVYRMRFNVAMSRINQIPLLENIKFIKKARDIYQFVYADQDKDNMAQLFYYMPAATWWLNEVGDTQGSVLQSDPLYPTYTYTMGDWLTRLETQITHLLESGTQNFIYADMLNMANKVHVQTWQFDYLAEDYTVKPIYNINASLQFHNMNIVGEPSILDGRMDVPASSSYPGFTITPNYDIMCDVNKNEIVYNPMFSVKNVEGAVTKGHIVDMPTDLPTVNERIEALRLHSAWSGMVIKATDLPDHPGDADSYTTCWALPDHWVVRMIVFTNITDNASTAEFGTNSETFEYSGYNVQTGVNPKLFRLQQFKGAPLMYLVDLGASDTQATGLYTLSGELDYYTSVDYKYIKRLLDVMYIGLFDFRVG